MRAPRFGGGPILPPMSGRHGDSRPAAKRIAFAAALLFLSLAIGAAAPLMPGIHQAVTFDRVSPLSSTGEIVRRTFSPLAARGIAAAASLAGQPLDVAQEKFVVYVPA